MESFKQIAEDCLAGKLSGTFILQDGSEVKSNYLRKLPPTTSAICSYSLYGWYISDNGNAYGDTGYLYSSSIKKFIPDNMQEQIKIDIPEGKVPVMEQTENGVVITWKEKEVTYTEIFESLRKDNRVIYHVTNGEINSANNSFINKINAIRKLTNIRNYFGGDKPTNSWLITIDSAHRPYVIKNPRSYRESCFIYFDTKEHAEQAIKMLGDELKYLFEPW